MWLYILLFAVIAFLYYQAKTPEQQQSYFKYAMIFLAIFVGISDMLGGYDRYIYADIFDECADKIFEGKNIFKCALFRMYSSEQGYCWWNVLVGFITHNRYIYILLTTFLIYFLFYRAIKRNTENPMFALIIFMALTFFFSFTYLRQILGVAFAWQAVEYIGKRNLKMFSLWMIVAFTFHNSAIIFFPVYFIPFRKFSVYLADTAMIVCLLVGISGISSGVFDVYSHASDSLTRINTENYSIETGFRWAYLLEAGFFYYYIRRYYDSLGNNVQSLVGLNLSIAFCCILLLFVHSENGGRLGWFFMIGLYSITTTIFSGPNRVAKPVTLMGVCFLLYFRIVFSWGMMLYPYKTFFSNGVRKGDRIEKKFEYDQKYKKDKFYR
ncbi:MAG: EpsG family protein [Bacteroidaceae bacterium]|nr:EpsG family protein [Bacteroidaceae bacterium]